MTDFKKFESKIFKKIEEEFNKAPEVRIYPKKPSDKKTAELMQKVLEHSWEENWPIVRADIKRRMSIMIQKCYLMGNHTWIGYGIKGQHVCRMCGLKAGIAYDPQFMGSMQSFWNLSNIGVSKVAKKEVQP